MLLQVNTRPTSSIHLQTHLSATCFITESCSAHCTPLPFFFLTLTHCPFPPLLSETHLTHTHACLAEDCFILALPTHLCPACCAGELPSRAKQLWRWMYYDNQWISSLRQTVGQQGGLSSAFCDKVQQQASVNGGLLLEEVVTAQDGTRKLVLRLTEGPAAGEGGRGCEGSDVYK